MGLKVKRSPLNQPNTGSPNSPLLILTLTSTGSHPHLFLLPDSSSCTAAASPPLPPHPPPPPSSTSAAAHPCLLHLRRQTASGQARRGSGAELAGAWCQEAVGGPVGGGCRAPGGRRQGEEWKSDADAQVFFPPGRLGDALKTLVGSTN